MMKLQALALTVILFSASSWASAAGEPETAWLKLTSRLDYTAADGTACDTKFELAYGYFAAELKDGKPQRAALEAWNSRFNHQGVLYLNRKELEGITLAKDDQGHWWLERLEATPRMVAWLLYYLNEQWPPCRPSALATISPSPTLFTFEWGGIPHGILISYSDGHELTGTRRDGIAFRIYDYYLEQSLLDWADIDMIREGGRISYATPR